MILFYHFPCFDGFTAAWVFWTKYGDTIEYKPFRFQELKNLEELENKDVVFVDCCPGFEELENLLDVCKSVKVIDHHVSNMKKIQDRIKQLENYSLSETFHPEDRMVFEDLAKSLSNACTFDMNMSGAGMAWEYIYPDEPMSKIVQHVQDRDIWNWEIPFTREITTVLYTYNMTFEQWDLAAVELEIPEEFDQWLVRGRAMLDYHKKLAEQIIKSAHRLVIDGTEVPAVCTTVIHSDVGSILARGEPFAATYYFTGEQWKISLRSDGESEDSVDVSAIATKYGGGGHRNAAGFRVDCLSDLANSR